MASIQYKADQMMYKGRGPLDAKSLVKTYADLINFDTWNKDGTFVAYNGMIVAVWLDKENATNNGIYYLFDPNVTTALKKPDVTNETNWHKISDSVDLTGIESLLNDLTQRVESLEAESKLHTYDYKVEFPQVGTDGHMYVAKDTQRTYVYSEGVGYLLVGAGFEETHDGELIINGGSAE